MEILKKETIYEKQKMKHFVTKSVLPTITDEGDFSIPFSYTKILSAKPIILKTEKITEKEFNNLKENIALLNDDFSIIKITITTYRNYEMVYPYARKYASNPQPYMAWVTNTNAEKEIHVGEKQSEKFVFEAEYPDAYKKHVERFIHMLDKYMNEDKTSTITYDSYYGASTLEEYTNMDFNNPEIVKIILDNYYMSKNNNICVKEWYGRHATKNAQKIIKNNPFWLKELYKKRDNK